MNTNPLYFTFLFTFFFTSCANGQISEIKIVNVSPGTQISIVSPYNSFNVPFQVTIESDENRVVVLPVELTSSRIIAVTYGFQKGFICLLSPGSECIYTLGNLNEICSITGDNYLVNKFLNKKNDLSTTFKYKGKSILEWDLNNDEAIEGFNLLEESIWQLFNDFKSQVGEHNAIVKNIEDYLYADLSSIKLNAVSKKFMVYDMTDFERIDKSYINIFNNVKLIDSLAYFAPNTYIMLLNYYSSILFNKHILNQYKGHKEYMEVFRETYMSKIHFDKFYFLSQQSLPSKTKEFMVADLLLNEVNESKTYDSLYYESIKYVENEEIQELLIRKGMAINLSDKSITERIMNLKGKTVDGNWKSFSELKGKVAYIDLWATWCGPCLAEFNYSKKLEESYRNSNVRFVYVSIDEDYEKWENFIAKTSSPIGLHLLFSKEEVALLNKAVYMNGIPRYILIGKHGNIVNINAPRPSDPKLIEILNELLKE
jgi:thiol-disulfide isomerase/thioredoxin